MKNTGVFATPEEKIQLLKLSEQASQTPVVAFSTDHALKGGMAGDAWRRAQEECHKIALAHGLPEIKGYYGLTHDGEFVCES